MFVTGVQTCALPISRIPPQLERNHVVPTSWQEEALARHGVSSAHADLIKYVKDCNCQKLYFDLDVIRVSLYLPLVTGRLRVLTEVKVEWYT